MYTYVTKRYRGEKSGERGRERKRYIYAYTSIYKYKDNSQVDRKKG
jgi:hypothetical protein